MSCDTVKKFRRSRGRMLVFAAPSGSGKTTIVHHLLEKFECLGFSVSATTREKRPHEKEGTDYYFLSVHEFREKIETDEFVEWEEVYTDRYYGTLRSEVERMWGEGKHILFDIDVKGALNIKAQYGERCLTVFVRPPSLEVLLERLRKRGTENEDSLRIRTERFLEEFSYESHFDKVLINDRLETALKESEKITIDFLDLPEK